jgi:hypothetical protein
MTNSSGDVERRGAGVALWAKMLGIIAIVVALLIIAMVVAGGGSGHNPPDHGGGGSGATSAAWELGGPQSRHFPPAGSHG